MQLFVASLVASNPDGTGLAGLRSGVLAWAVDRTERPRGRLRRPGRRLDHVSTRCARGRWVKGVERSMSERPLRPYPECNGTDGNWPSRTRPSPHGGAGSLVQD